MGDLDMWVEECPKCGQETLEFADKPTSLLYYNHCGNCGFSDGKQYYELDGNIISLMTGEEYKVYERMKHANNSQ